MFFGDHCGLEITVVLEIAVVCVVLWRSLQSGDRFSLEIAVVVEVSHSWFRV